jgi:hypothetical protein
MAREIQITPRRIHYAQEKEAGLYKSLMVVASEKQKEITHLIEVTLQDMREELVDIAAVYQYHGMCSVYNRITVTLSFFAGFYFTHFIYSVMNYLLRNGLFHAKNHWFSKP